ncbi:hypothetical protein [Falsibacillus albus]|uniref:Uncharacterized protein n=1 Tax=Falsibacillus albus TaxID=2478915 RepID=A0A3L7K0X8_9BACI|nr:hypothetical protein [Falsibacillus albus]RLQ96706.1 hypothetical protein D9X91_06270 [Falsibacillus albus]
MLAQDKELFDSDTSHEEKCLPFFKDVPNLIEHPPYLSWLRCGISLTPHFPLESPACAPINSLKQAKINNKL